jgi:hypothetical protein
MAKTVGTIFRRGKPKVEEMQKKSHGVNEHVTQYCHAALGY